MKKQLFILYCFAAFAVAPVLACTSAIIGADRTANGRPLLWKHRDTSNIDNIVEYIAPSDDGFGFTGLFNASDSLLQQCWTGFNSEGFAIMNTASYNIKDDDVAEKDMDKEGFLMTKALRTCRTVDDFEDLLRSLPRPMGVEANFGVIDASGAGAFFETNNHSFVRFNVEDATDHVLVRSNYSHSGREKEGYGYIREENAWRHLRPFVKNSNVTPELLTERISRSFYHSLWDKDFAADPNQRWIIDQDFIPRYKSCATIVIEGSVPEDYAPRKTDNGQQTTDYVMWTGLGYPPCAVIYPVTEGPDGVHPDLRGLSESHHSKASDDAKAFRDKVFPMHYDNGDKYIDLLQLRNEEGSGLMQQIVRKNLKTYNDFRGDKNNVNARKLMKGVKLNRKFKIKKK